MGGTRPGRTSPPRDRQRARLPARRPSRRSRPSRTRPWPTSPSAARTRCSAGASSSASCASRTSGDSCTRRVERARRLAGRRRADVRPGVDDARVDRDAAGGSSPSPAPPAACQPVATGGYLGAENQMIRVLVTSVDATACPTIVWGFDDASFLYRLTRQRPTPARAPRRSRSPSAPVDSYHYPAAGQAVELLRDAAQPHPGGPQRRHGRRLHRRRRRARCFAFTQAYESLADTVTSPATPARRRHTPPALPAGVAGIDAGARRHRGGTDRRRARTPGVTVTLSLSRRRLPPRRLLALRAAAQRPTVIYPARYLAAPQPPEGARVLACPIALVLAGTRRRDRQPRVPVFDNLSTDRRQAAAPTAAARSTSPPPTSTGTSLNTLLTTYARRVRSRCASHRAPTR